MYLIATGESPFRDRQFDRDLVDIMGGLRPSMPDSQYKKLPSGVVMLILIGVQMRGHFGVIFASLLEKRETIILMTTRGMPFIIVLDEKCTSARYSLFHTEILTSKYLLCSPQYDLTMNVSNVMSNKNFFQSTNHTQANMESCASFAQLSIASETRAWLR